jgi:uncharacterized protein (TIGR03435 family)
METTRFDVAAKVPAGVTKVQFREMQRHLLEERFRLAVHWQPRDATVYELTIGKAGLKMRESAPADTAAPEVDYSVVAHYSVGKDKFPVFPAGASGLMGVNNHHRWRSSNVTMADIVRVLRRQMNSDVLDRTGLHGKYDVDMYWQQPSLEIFPSSPPFEGPAIDKAIQDALGLKLEPKKGSVSVLTVDHLEKTPIEN